MSAADRSHHISDGEDARALRHILVDEVGREAGDTAFWTGRAHFDQRVLDALNAVPRHAFLPGEPLRVAYVNRPQPIGHGQTISQPYIVALMTDLLDLRGGERVLDVGAGCGYQSAVLAELAGEVFAVERLEPLANRAQETLADLGYTNVHVTARDGTRGWPEHAPFDAILVAACEEREIPQALIEQLAPGGRLVIPIGPRFGPQMLHVGHKDANGRFTHEPVLAVAFVPLVSDGE